MSNFDIEDAIFWLQRAFLYNTRTDFVWNNIIPFKKTAARLRKSGSNASRGNKVIPLFLCTVSWWQVGRLLSKGSYPPLTIKRVPEMRNLDNDDDAIVWLQGEFLPIYNHVCVDNLLSKKPAADLKGSGSNGCHTVMFDSFRSLSFQYIA